PVSSCDDVLRNYLEVHPLRADAIFVSGQLVGDCDLEGIVSGLELCSELQGSPGDYAAQVYRLGCHSRHWTDKYRPAVSKNRYLSLELRLMSRCIRPSIVNHKDIIEQHTRFESPARGTGRRIFVIHRAFLLTRRALSGVGRLL